MFCRRPSNAMSHARYFDGCVSGQRLLAARRSRSARRRAVRWQFVIFDEPSLPQGCYTSQGKSGENGRGSVILGTQRRVRKSPSLFNAYSDCANLCCRRTVREMSGDFSLLFL